MFFPSKSNLKFWILQFCSAHGALDQYQFGPLYQWGRLESSGGDTWLRPFVRKHSELINVRSIQRSSHLVLQISTTKGDGSQQRNFRTVYAPL